MTFQFPRVRGRGWNRGGYPGGNNNNNSSNGNPANNMNPPVRPPDEEWDPEYTPKSRKYYLVSGPKQPPFISFIHSPPLIECDVIL